MSSVDPIRTELDLGEWDGTSARRGVSNLPLPPLVPGLPLIGNLLSLRNDPIHFLVDCAAKYGPIFRLKGPGNDVTVLAGPEGAELVQRDGSNGLHRREIFNAFSTEAGVDIFGIQGEQHAQLRRLVKLGYARQTAAQFVSRMEKDMLPVFRAWQSGEELNLFEVTSRLSLYCVMAAATPVDLKAHSEDIIRFGNTVMYAVTKGRPPFTLFLPKYKKIRDRVYRILDQVIDRHRKGEFSAATEMHLTDAFLQVRGPDGSGMTERDVRGGLAYALCGTEIYIGRLAGFLVFELLKNRRLLGHVQAEIDAAFGHKRAIDSNLFSRMPYLRGSYFETLRVYPLLPGLPFTAERDLEVQGYRIPKGNLVLVTSVPWHFSQTNYENPHVFDATRCMAPRNEHLKPGAFAPFGVGKRTCAAGGMVEVLTLTLVSALLREWDLELVKPSYQMRVTPRPLIAPSDGVPIRTVARRDRKEVLGKTVLAEKSELLSVIPEHRALEYLPPSREIRFPAGEILLREGEKSDRLYVLLEGEAEVVRGPTQESLARLRAGRIFGETGLLKGLPRNADVVARTAIHVLEVERRAFLDWMETTDHTALELGLLLQQQYLQQAILRALPGARGIENLQGVRMETFSIGEIILRQGDPADTFYVLTSGTVEVIRTDDQGKERLEAELSSGAFFGEMGILNRAPRNATIKSKTAVEVVSVDRERFIDWLQTNATAREDVALTVCRRLLAGLNETKKAP